MATLDDLLDLTVGLLLLDGVLLDPQRRQVILLKCKPIEYFSVAQLIFIPHFPEIFRMAPSIEQRVKVPDSFCFF